MARILARLELAFAKLTTLTLRQELKELLERTRNPALSERGMISILTVLVELGNQQSTEMNCLLTELQVTDQIGGTELQVTT